MSRHHDHTQVARVRAFMSAGHSIESAEAWRRFGITRLASVIDDLRRSGADITTELVPFKAQSGVYSRFARYRLRACEHARSKDYTDGVYQWVDKELYMLLHPVTGHPLEYRFASAGTAFGSYEDVVELMNRQGLPFFVAVRLSAIKAFRVT